MSYALRSSPGSLAMLAAMRRASSFSEELIDAGWPTAPTVRGLRRLRDKRAAVAVGGGDKARGRVVAEKRDFRDVGSLP